MSPKQKWIAFIFLLLAQFMVILDATIVTVALPSIQRAFHLTLGNLQWIITAYTLSFGGFLLLGGRMADMFGRKRVFLIGLTSFTSASLLIGLLSSGDLIIPLRAIQGLSAAFLSPAALSMVLTMFSEEHSRTRALSIWSTVAAVGGTIGLLLGGILTQFLDWRWNFFVNVPIGIIVLIGSFLLLPAHSSEERTKKIDAFGAVLITTALMLLVYTITNASSWGWGSLHTLGFLLIFIALFGGFIWNEKKVMHPLIPLSIFKIGNIASANTMMLFYSMTGFPALIMLTLYNQSFNHYSPLQSGSALVPLGILIGTMSILAPRFIKAFRIKKILIFAPFTAALGMVMLMHLPAHANFLSDELLPSLIWPLGLGPAMVALFVSATNGVPAHESGLASGLINTFQQIGFALGLAIISSIASVEPGLQGYHSAFGTIFWIALLTPLLAIFFIKQRKK